MSAPSSDLHLPLTFDRGPEVTLLGSRLGDPARAQLFAFRLWLEWGTAVTGGSGIFRPLAAGGDDDLAADPLVTVIEHFIGWDGPPGGFIGHALAAGLIRREQHGAQAGLVLHGFARHNAHLSPFHLSAEKRGGIQKGIAAFRRRDATAMARQQIELRARRSESGDLALPGDLDRNRYGDAVCLIHEIDRACGRPVRDPVEDSLALQAAAAYARTERGAIDTLLQWIVGHRGDPSVALRTENLLRDWDGFVARAASE